ncbi:NAD(P)/FAD-dependent oxidoreductase [Caulobacter vibrioides]|uniref:FAD dependent oxidoreductase n=1 Tax=Caulobacter vibrioides (strain NA1000 / CB15N) TaxID=565050 RepID=A0A0H3CB78_CAUVN|nr:NAD(P)/FAD-dependent oxidoreductase [Caulobacter vibrioides]YP_002518056.2 FAD dependent oxidoreductase [Caulobacter vibrioides NA1000]ACL96148.2 FAD dependent oxidoreductase [Caulobacter vibrioides NA1000]QXZ50963.1 NAD(P)/FAD-dependent oxidoreductase [Caulobacter vibrioides]
MANVVPRQSIAVIGAGVSGLSAAWLLSHRHDVTLYEADNRLGGHANTIIAEGVAVDTGFIVYNEPNYPNLTALFRHIGVETTETDMSFGVSLDGGALEYSSTKLLAQKRNVANPRFIKMLLDVVRFYREGRNIPADLEQGGLCRLDDYLRRQGFGRAFQEDHLLPQAAAIWSASMRDIREFPAAALLRFFDNHGLMLPIDKRPIWRTVVGGSARYVEKLAAGVSGPILTGRPVKAIHRGPDGVRIEDATGETRAFDHVVIGAHADQALSMLAAPSAEERELLGAFRYSRNRAVLHSDPALMPRRRGAWASWNHVGRRGEDGEGGVTYWMNILQPLGVERPYFLSLNPMQDPAGLMHDQVYEHPLFDGPAMLAQRRLWSLQGRRRTWFCGAYFGSGFHEDGLQAGLAVAEQLGGVRRPWLVPNPSGRIVLDVADQAADRELVA